jgi:gas vesicle protein
MKDKYLKIEFSWGSTIESAGHELIEHNKNGVFACGEFNGTTLYSDTVTMDGAYKEIIGKTKEEFDESQKKWREDSEKREAEFKDNIPSLTEEWKAKGRQVLDQDKWDYWDEIVPIRLTDLYHGMELGNCLKVVKILNEDGSLEEAKKEIESQGHSGMSFGLVRAMVKEFCDRGKEFTNYVS